MTGTNTARKTGLIKIYNCDDPNRSGDVIFVHGLGDHPIKAWYPTNRKDRKDIEKQVDTKEFRENKLPKLDFWLYWLSQDRPDLGIWSYGYEAMPVGAQGGGNPILFQGSEFLGLLLNNNIRPKPRIFVTHSLGGLIVKQVLSKAWNTASSNHKMSEFINQTKGVVFLGTPHQGADVDTLKGLILSIVEAFGLIEKNPILEELSSEQTNTKLVELNDFYRDNVKAMSIETKVFFETKSTKIRNVMDKIIVDVHSSNPGIPGVLATAVNQADHLTLCKPQDKDASVYLGVTDFIEDCLPKQDLSSSVHNETAISEKDWVKQEKKS